MYPGKNFFSDCTFAPRLISTTSSVGTRTSSMSDPISLELICSSIFWQTFFSEPEKTCTTYHFFAITKSHYQKVT